MKACIQTKITVNETNNKLQKKRVKKIETTKPSLPSKLKTGTKPKNHNRPEMMEIENFRFKKSTNAINQNHKPK